MHVISAKLKGRPMSNRNSNVTALHQETGHTLFAYGLWIRIGFVGASVALAGLLMLFDAESTAATALLVLLGGAALAAMAWRKIRTVLALLEERETGAPETSMPASASRTASIPRAASMQATAR